jgi:hypothetical protein
MKSPYTKKELKRLLRPGTWVQVRWDDAPDSVELVIAKPDWAGQTGDVDVDTISFGRDFLVKINTPYHGQIVHVFEGVKVVPPAPTIRGKPYSVASARRNK